MIVFNVKKEVTKYVIYTDSKQDICYPYPLSVISAVLRMSFKHINKKILL